MLDLLRDEDGLLISYAWPGGYVIVYVCKDGSVLCPTCARQQEIDNAKARLERDWLDASEEIAGYQGNEEDCNLYCDECGKWIEADCGCDEEN